MTWTYDSDYTTQRDRVRFLVGDTDSADPLVTDEEIALYGTGGTFAQSNDYLAAASVVDGIAAKLARRVSISAGGTSVQLQQQAENFTKLAKELRRRSLSGTGVAVFAGGISQASKDTYTDDTDNIVPAFTRRQSDPPNTDPLTRDELGYG